MPGLANPRRRVPNDSSRTGVIIAPPPADNRPCPSRPARTAARLTTPRPREISESATEPSGHIGDRLNLSQATGANAIFGWCTARRGVWTLHVRLEHELWRF